MKKAGKVTITSLSLLGALSLGVMTDNIPTFAQSMEKVSIISEIQETQFVPSKVQGSIISEAESEKPSIAIVNAFEKYFGENMKPKAIESLRLIKESENNGVYFYSKIVDPTKPRDETDVNKALIEVNPETKKIESINIHYTLDFNKAKDQEVTTEEGKQLSDAFIKEHQLVKNIDHLQYLGEFRMGPLSVGMLYKYQDNKVIHITVSATTERKVTGFSYIDEDTANTYVNYTDYLETGEIG